MIRDIGPIDLAFQFGSRGDFPPQAGFTVNRHAMIALQRANGVNWE
jgi:hypothetical protein